MAPAFACCFDALDRELLGKLFSSLLGSLFLESVRRRVMYNHCQPCKRHLRIASRDDLTSQILKCVDGSRLHAYLDAFNNSLLEISFSFRV